MASLSFFVGKGGVGKTTLSSAFAVHSALKNPRSRVLLISTDPAHSLGDIFEQKFKSEPTAVKLSRAHLFLWQVDAESRFRRFLDEEREQILKILESGSIFTREDIAPLLDTAMPGMAEMSALLAVHDVLGSGKYDQVVVDTAPFGHTLRMFQMPEHFVRFLDFLELASSRDQVLAQHFGGSTRKPAAGLIERWRDLADEILTAFSQRARILLVTTPEKFSLNEAVRCRDAMRDDSRLEFTDVVLNRAVLRPGRCPTCQARSKSTTTAKRTIAKEFAAAASLVAVDLGFPILGCRALEAFGGHVFEGKSMRWRPASPPSRTVRLKAARWPRLDAPLSLVLGKGGVGKTTISAALGSQTRETSTSPVEICSVDPAPSLDDVFQAEITDTPTEVLGDPQFRASELDSAAMFRLWVAEIKGMLEQPVTSEGVHVDLWFERQLFSQLLDSVPPGLDEILAVFRILDLTAHKKRRVVIDMAPTGHAIDLLRTPERILVWTRLLLKTLAPHRTLAIVRDAGLKVAELGQHVRELLESLKDPSKTQLIVVMLAEPLPDRETNRLLGVLKKLGIHLRSVFVNRFQVDVTPGCKRCTTAQRWQRWMLSQIVEQHSDVNPYVVRNFPAEVAGEKSIHRLTRQIWLAN